MALVLQNKHHRNPSGLNNKIKWILSECKYSYGRYYFDLIHELIVNASNNNSKSYESWLNAISISSIMLTDLQFKKIEKIDKKSVEYYKTTWINRLSKDN